MLCHAGWANRYHLAVTAGLPHQPLPRSIARLGQTWNKAGGAIEQRVRGGLVQRFPAGRGGRQCIYSLEFFWLLYSGAAPARFSKSDLRDRCPQLHGPSITLPVIRLHSRTATLTAAKPQKKRATRSKINAGFPLLLNID